MNQITSTINDNFIDFTKIIPKDQLFVDEEWVSHIKYHSFVTTDISNSEKVIHHYTCNALSEKLCNRLKIKFVGNNYMSRSLDSVWNWYLQIPVKAIEKYIWAKLKNNISQSELSVLCENYLAKMSKIKIHTPKKDLLDNLSQT